VQFKRKLLLRIINCGFDEFAILLSAIGTVKAAEKVEQIGIQMK
jgi:hypothetical protein